MVHSGGAEGRPGSAPLHPPFLGGVGGTFTCEPLSLAAASAPARSSPAPSRWRRATAGARGRGQGSGRLPGRSCPSRSGSSGPAPALTWALGTRERLLGRIWGPGPEPGGVRARCHGLEGRAEGGLLAARGPSRGVLVQELGATGTRSDVPSCAGAGLPLGEPGSFYICFWALSDLFWGSRSQSVFLGPGERPRLLGKRRRCWGARQG